MSTICGSYKSRATAATPINRVTLAPILSPELPKTGLLGCTGVTGLLGCTGITGLLGCTGADDLVGFAGPPGPAGPVGPAGDVPLPFPYGGITEGRPV
jgi:collagen type VII alpha